MSLIHRSGSTTGCVAGIAYAIARVHNESNVIAELSGSSYIRRTRVRGSNTARGHRVCEDQGSASWVTNYRIWRDRRLAEAVVRRPYELLQYKAASDAIVVADVVEIRAAEAKMWLI